MELLKSDLATILDACTTREGLPPLAPALKARLTYVWANAIEKAVMVGWEQRFDKEDNISIIRGCAKWAQDFLA